MNKKLVDSMVMSQFLRICCGKGTERNNEWKGPTTEGLPDSIIAIETNGDTLRIEDFEKTIDSLEYYMGKYFREQ